MANGSGDAGCSELRRLEEDQVSSGKDSVMFGGCLRRLVVKYSADSSQDLTANA